MIDFHLYDQKTHYFENVMTLILTKSAGKLIIYDYIAFNMRIFCV